MTKEESGKYSVMIRGDYLRQLGRVKGDLDRDLCIQDAVEEFLILPRDERRREAKIQGVSITHSADSVPEYYMWLQIISIPDDLVARLKASDAYVDSEKMLNAAIRLWLKRKKGVEGLKP